MDCSYLIVHDLAINYQQYLYLLPFFLQFGYNKMSGIKTTDYQMIDQSEFSNPELLQTLRQCLICMNNQQCITLNLNSWYQLIQKIKYNQKNNGQLVNSDYSMFDDLINQMKQINAYSVQKSQNVGILVNIAVKLIDFIVEEKQKRMFTDDQHSREIQYYNDLVETLQDKNLKLQIENEKYQNLLSQNEVQLNQIQRRLMNIQNIENQLNSKQLQLIPILKAQIDNLKDQLNKFKSNKFIQLAQKYNQIDINISNCSIKTFNQQGFDQDQQNIHQEFSQDKTNQFQFSHQTHQNSTKPHNLADNYFNNTLNLCELCQNQNNLENSYDYGQKEMHQKSISLRSLQSKNDQIQPSLSKSNNNIHCLNHEWSQKTIDNNFLSLPDILSENIRYFSSSQSFQQKQICNLISQSDSKTNLRFQQIIQFQNEAKQNSQISTNFDSKNSNLQLRYLDGDDIERRDKSVKNVYKSSFFNILLENKYYSAIKDFVVSKRIKMN